MEDREKTSITFSKALAKEVKKRGIDRDLGFSESLEEAAEFARERGIVHEIREFQLPGGAPVLSFVFKR